MQTKVIDYESSLRNQVAATSQEQTITKHEVGGPSALEASELILAGVLAWQLLAARVGAFLSERFNPWAPVVETEETLPGSLSEEESFEAFAAALNTGPGADPPPVAESPGAVPCPDREECAQPSRLETFFTTAPEETGSLRKLFGSVGRCNNEAARSLIFEELLIRIQSLKELADLPELKPAWQMSAMLEGVLNSLASKPGNLTPSCLRTVASGLDLLTELCVSGVPSCLAANPPVRLLAVDDDAICRIAISSALKKVFTAPELAVDGKTAFALADKEKFDMIFLDVEMPGMNGFELCAKIRQTPDNGQTPVVFVTSHSDFNSRAQLPLAGAQDLIAKPFMSFEVALKALTFVLRGRLAASRKPVEAAAKSPDRPKPAVRDTKMSQQPVDLYLNSQVGAMG